ncbi:hypothetical protein COBT_001924, partial [Conglomerata obtusa]
MEYKYEKIGYLEAIEQIISSNMDAFCYGQYMFSNDIMFTEDQTEIEKVVKDQQLKN